MAAAAKFQQHRNTKLSMLGVTSVPERGETNALGRATIQHQGQGHT